MQCINKKIISYLIIGTLQVGLGSPTVLAAHLFYGLHEVAQLREGTNESQTHYADLQKNVLENDISDEDISEILCREEQKLSLVKDTKRDKQKKQS